MAMRIAVVNHSGNVGKTTTAKNVFARKLKAKLFTIETINDTDTIGPKINAKQFGHLIEAMALEEDVVVDVGASNSEMYFKEMHRFNGSHEDIDIFFVPCTPPLKQQQDTISTVEALAALQVPPSKIRVGFNNVDSDYTVEQVFRGLLEYEQEHKRCMIFKDAVISSTDLFSKLRLADLTIDDVLSDTRNFKELISAASSKEEKLQLIIRMNLRRLAIVVEEELDHFFLTILSAP